MLDTVLDSGYLPHAIIRMGIRRQLTQRSREIESPTLTEAVERKMAFVEELRHAPIAIKTNYANEQHYEVGTGVMAATLGPRMKYSCSLFLNDNDTLEQAEDNMLASYLMKGDFQDGMSILDIGSVCPTEYGVYWLNHFTEALSHLAVAGVLPCCTWLRNYPTRKLSASPTPGRKRSTLTALPRRRDSRTSR
jgi:hypothetical protein